VLDYVLTGADRMFREKEAMIGSEVMRGLEKHVMLSVLDNGWKEHLASMDYLRQGIYLRGYAQQQPKQEFKREAFELFQVMLGRIKHEIIQMLARVRIRSEDEVEQMELEQRRRAEEQARAMQFQHAETAGFSAPDLPADPGAGAQAPMPILQTPMHRDAPKVGRNDPCPCGSGKKYKQCHGKLA
jgi:preprotein translocase subunit SecA